MMGSRKRPSLSITSPKRLACVAERSRWNGVGATLSIGNPATIVVWPPSGSR
jgi:hypothetical protein